MSTPVRFMKLGLQGISICVASGDSGVAGPPDDDNPDGCLGNGTIFSPDFPATCKCQVILGHRNHMLIDMSPMLRPILDHSGRHILATRR